MASNSRDWIRSITFASPVLLATVLSLILAVNAIVNPVEAVNPGADITDGQGQNGRGQAGENVVNMTAEEIYLEYIEAAAAGESIAFHPLTGAQVRVTGILASWDHTGEPFVTMLTDSSGGNNVRFTFNYSFTDETVMRELIGAAITVSGISRGLIDGVVILRDGSSHDFDINSPAIQG